MYYKKIKVVDIQIFRFYVISAIKITPAIDFPFFKIMISTTFVFFVRIIITNINQNQPPLVRSFIFSIYHFFLEGRGKKGYKIVLHKLMADYDSFNKHES